MTLIRDPHLRLQIHTQKQTKILHWLKTEIYSSSEILTLVLGLNHRQSLDKVFTTEDIQRMKNLLAQATERLARKDSAALKQMEAYKQQFGVKHVFRVGTSDNWTQ